MISRCDESMEGWKEGKLVSFAASVYGAVPKAKANAADMSLHDGLHRPWKSRRFVETKSLLRSIEEIAEACWNDAQLN